MAAALQQSLSHTSDNDSFEKQFPVLGKTIVAPHAINREKALNKLASAALSDMSDFTVEVNDSCGNVNMKCSPAFYAAVAKPALEALPPNWSSDPVGGCTCSLLTSPTILQDITALNQHTQLKIHVNTNTSPPSALGHVTIHLHNTQHMVQVQGKKRAPDQKSLAVWSVQNLIVPLWKKASSDVNFGPEVVQYINQSVIALASGTARSAASTASSIRSVPGKSTCSYSECKRNTIAKNLTPILCTKKHCGKFFHIKCEPKHTCLPISRTPAGAIPKTLSGSKHLQFNSPSFLKARQQLNIESDGESDEEPSPEALDHIPHKNSVALRPSCLPPRPPAPFSGPHLVTSSL